jgi:hypothetical protein
MECYVSVKVDFFKMNFSDEELLYSFSNIHFVSRQKAGKYSCLKMSNYPFVSVSYLCCIYIVFLHLPNQLLVLNKIVIS